jgi:hypothetical protein
MRSLVLCALVVAGSLWGAPVAVGNPVGCLALGGVVQNGGVCQVRDSQPSYTMDVTFPLGYPDSQAVIDYLGQTKAGFLNLAQTPGSPNLPYEMDVTGESFASAQTRSLVLTLFQAVGSAHPSTWYKSFTYDLGRARPVTFETMFSPDAAPLDAIFPIVSRDLETRTGLSVLPGDGRDPANYQNFAITDDAVIFFFGRAEMLPSYADAVSVSVPRDAIPPLQI